MLHGCEKQNVCTFPVYPTEFCPRNQTEWDKRSSDMNCNETNSYMCVPNEKFTELLEFCYKHPRMLIVQDTCLYLSRSHYDVNIYDCRNFEYGCPSYHYLSSSIYKYPSCTHVKNGCFVAEPSCKRQPPERENQINIKTIAITLGVSIPTCILCILFVYFVMKRRYYICKRMIHVESHGEEGCETHLQTPDLNEMPLGTTEEECHICERKGDVESPGEEESIPLFSATDLNKMHIQTEVKGYHICETESDVESPGEEECKTLLRTAARKKISLGTNEEGTNTNIH